MVVLSSVLVRYTSRPSAHQLGRKMGGSSSHHGLQMVSICLNILKLTNLEVPPILRTSIFIEYYRCASKLLTPKTLRWLDCWQISNGSFYRFSQPQTTAIFFGIKVPDVNLLVHAIQLCHVIQSFLSKSARAQRPEARSRMAR